MSEALLSVENLSIGFATETGFVRVVEGATFAPWGAGPCVDARSSHAASDAIVARSAPRQGKDRIGKVWNAPEALASALSSRSSAARSRR